LRILEVQIKREIWKMRLHFQTKSFSADRNGVHASARQCSRVQFWGEMVFFFSVNVKQITFSFKKCNILRFTAFLLQFLSLKHVSGEPIRAGA